MDNTDMSQQYLKSPSIIKMQSTIVLIMDLLLAVDMTFALPTGPTLIKAHIPIWVIPTLELVHQTLLSLGQEIFLSPTMKCFLFQRSNGSRKNSGRHISAAGVENVAIAKGLMALLSLVLIMDSCIFSL